MSAHWRIALRGAVWMLALVLVVAAILLFVLDAGHSWSFTYGSGMGILSFVSMALTVSLMAGKPGVVMAMVGASSFFVRLGVAAVTLGVPAYLEMWPVLPMLGGFAGVYLAENLFLLRMIPKTASGFGTKRDDGRDSQGGRAERKVGI